MTKGKEVIQETELETIRKKLAETSEFARRFAEPELRRRFSAFSESIGVEKYVGSGRFDFRATEDSFRHYGVDLNDRLIDVLFEENPDGALELKIPWPPADDRGRQLMFISNRKMYGTLAFTTHDTPWVGLVGSGGTALQQEAAKLREVFQTDVINDYTNSIALFLSLEGLFRNRIEEIKRIALKKYHG